MFTYGSSSIVITKQVYIPPLDLSVTILPQNTTLQYDSTGMPSDWQDWPDFHNGVAAGLRISPASRDVDSSWIVFNKPSELTPKHAGFLLGIGLTGHLRSMVTWHAFSYLTPKHDLTSIGVLLGLSAAYIGTGDPLVTKLLSVHIPALLPAGSTELNLSALTQASGLLGTGILYLGTRHRHMSDVMLAEIGRKEVAVTDTRNDYRESYSLSASLAFGMIMIGVGDTQSSPAETAAITRLRGLVACDPALLRAQPLSGGRFHAELDVNVTSPGATIALGMMFLRTNRADMAATFEVPDTLINLDHVRPDFLLLRVLARNLIMWESLSPTKSWVEAQLPLFIRKAIRLRQSKHRPVEEAIDLAYYNIIAGACFSIGLKYAGTADRQAYRTLIEYFDKFTKTVNINRESFPIPSHLSKSID